MHEIVANAGKIDISLEDIARNTMVGMHDFQGFLREWTEYFADRSMNDAMERILEEAVDLLDDFSTASGYALRMAGSHPGICLRLLKNGGQREPEAMVALGLQAVRKIPKKYVAREKTALMTAEWILRSGLETGRLASCYFAAYESDTCPVG